MVVERGERCGGGGGIGCLSCCFGGGGGGEGKGEELGQRAARALRTSSLWVRNRAVELPDMVARAGRRRRKSHQHQQRQQQLAVEFHYDPVSYALNFEEDGDGEAKPFKYSSDDASAHSAVPRTRRGSTHRDAIATDELVSEARLAQPSLLSRRSARHSALSPTLPLSPPASREERRR